MEGGKSWHFKTPSHKHSSSTCYVPGVCQAPSVCWIFLDLTPRQTLPLPLPQSLGRQRLGNSCTAGVTLELGWVLSGEGRFWAIRVCPGRPGPGQVGGRSLPRGCRVPEMKLHLGTGKPSAEPSREDARHREGGSPGGDRSPELDGTDGQADRHRRARGGETQAGDRAFLAAAVPADYNQAGAQTRQAGAHTHLPRLPNTPPSGWGSSLQMQSTTWPPSSICAPTPGLLPSCPMNTC